MLEGLLVNSTGDIQGTGLEAIALKNSGNSCSYIHKLIYSII